MVKKYNFSDPIIINFIPNPITYSIIRNINFNLVVYYMADNRRKMIRNLDK